MQPSKRSALSFLGAFFILALLSVSATLIVITTASNTITTNSVPTTSISNTIATSTTTTTVAPSCYYLTISTHYSSTSGSTSPTTGGGYSTYSSSGCPGSWGYLAGSAVTISAKPSTNYAFVGWAGTGSGSYTGNAISANVIMNTNITETIYFIYTASATTTTATSTTSTIPPTTNSICSGCTYGTCPNGLNCVPYTTSSCTSGTGYYCEGTTTSTSTIPTITTMPCPTTGCKNTTSTISTLTTTLPSCPSFYWYNASAGRCQPQLISPTCPANTPNSPVYYICSPLSAFSCPNWYAFMQVGSYGECILTSTITTTTVPPSNTFYLKMIAIQRPSCGLANGELVACPFYLTILPSSCITPGSGWYASSSPVTIAANATCNGASFTSWQGYGSGNYTGTSTSTTITMNGNISETAYYTRYITVSTSTTLSTTLPPYNGFYPLVMKAEIKPCHRGETDTVTCQYTGLEILPEKCVTPGSGIYPQNAVVNITANATCLGGVFYGWNGIGTGSFTGTSQSASVTMLSPTSETAIYTLPSVNATTTIPPYATYTLSLSSGWNLFSVPLMYAAKISTSCQSGSAESPIWELDNGAYSRAGYIYGGRAYWIRLANPCTVTFYGPPLELTDLPSLHVGWNLVGALNFTTPFSTILGTCPVVRGPFGFNTTVGSYYNATNTVPGNGYFVKVSSDCAAQSGPPSPPI